MAKKVLFVCTGNVDRSPTAEALLKQKEGCEVRSAGTWIHARRRISTDLIDWADIIFVMEEQHKESIMSMKPEAKSKITVLGIPDIYSRNSPRLVNILKNKLAEHLATNW
jgi:predicted protein tyrosine phosphatase